MRGRKGHDMNDDKNCPFCGADMAKYYPFRFACGTCCNLQIEGGYARGGRCYQSELAQIKAERDRLRRYNDKLPTYCAYCGYEVPIDDEAASKISEHIATCLRHPMRIVEAERDLLAKQAKRYHRNEDNINADGPLDAHLWYHCACGVIEDGHEKQECLYHQEIRKERDRLAGQVATLSEIIGRAAKVVKLARALIQPTVDGGRIELEGAHAFRSMLMLSIRALYGDMATLSPPDPESEVQAEYAARALNQHEKLMAMLRRYEWVATPGGGGALCCLECGGRESYGHETGCAWGVLLAEEKAGQMALFAPGPDELPNTQS